MASLKDDIVGRRLLSIEYMPNQILIKFSDSAYFIINTSVVCELRAIDTYIYVEDVVLDENYTKVIFNSGSSISISREISFSAHPEIFIYYGADGLCVVDA